MNKKQLLLGIAVSSFISVGAMAGEGHKETGKAAKKMAKETKVKCQQDNKCGGHGACGGVDNACKGKNKCGNHKFMAANKGACKAAGGKVIN